MILRELFVKLGLDVDEASFAKGHLAAELVKSGFEKLIEVGKEAVHAFIKNTHAVIEYGDKIQKTSQSIGIATDALQELQYAGSLADLSAQEMSQSIGILSRKMLEAKQGSEEAGKAFKGIAFQAGGKLLATDEVLGNIADKFASMPDGAEKTAMAMQLFGRAGKQMIPLLNKGSKDLEELREEARSLGLVLGSETTKQAEELNDDLHRLHAVTTGLWRQAIAPLIPAMVKVVKAFLEWRKESAKGTADRLGKGLRFVWDIVRRLANAVMMLGSVFVEAGKGINFLWNELSTTAKVVTVLIAGLYALQFASIRAAIASGAAWAKALLPFTLLYLILDDIRVFMNGGDSLLGDFVKFIDDWSKPREGDTWLVVQLKEFVRYIKEAIELLKDLDEVFGDGTKKRAMLDRQAGASKNEVRRSADNQTLETAKQRLAQGLPLTDAAKEALKRQGVKPEAFASRYAPSASSPEARTSAGSAGGSSVTAPVQINVTQSAGENGEDFARRVGDVVTTFWNGQLDAAGAGVRR